MAMGIVARCEGRCTKKSTFKPDDGDETFRSALIAVEGGSVKVICSSAEELSKFSEGRRYVVEGEPFAKKDVQCMRPAKIVELADGAAKAA